uniref:SCP domain-containing protein n=1 Tax=Strongyloides papillosus TaxID=174720 RepID=A0A0N5BMY6_STREA
MHILYNSYYIKFVILFILFSKYYALENNVENFKSPSIDLVQNDLSSKNFLNQDSLVHSISGNNENKYLIKRQAGGKGGQNKQKSAAKKVSKTKVPIKKPPSSRPKPPVPKPQVRKTTNRRTTTKATTTRKSTTKATTAKKSSSKRIIKTTSRTTTKKPVTPTKKTTSNKATQKTTRSTNTVTTTRKRRPKPKTTPRPDKYAHLKSKVSSLYIFTNIFQILNEINDLRLKHQAQNLTVDPVLAKKAQYHAEKYAAQLRVPFYEDNSIKTLIYTTRIGDAFNPMSLWTGGSIFVDFEKLDQFEIDIPFTQLIWVSTTTIGCGISEDKSRSEILTVCLFYPKGNIPGQYSKNIFKAIETNS